MKRKTILITGGLGFVGGRITKRLALEHDVIVSSRKPVPFETVKIHGNLGFVLHSELFQPSTFPKEIETIIHLAALNEHDCLKYPSEAIRVNIDQTRIILENAVTSGVKNFIYFSTAHVYGSPLVGEITENTLPVPIHPYAITHKAAEDYVIAATLQKKINGIVIRLSNSFGTPVLPDVNRWTLLANDLCRQAIEKGSLTLLSNGCQYRDFVCLSDVEEVIETILNSPKDFKKMIYNLGAGKSMRVIDMANAIVSEYSNLFSKELPINLPKGIAATDEPLLTFSIDRLLQEGCVINNDVTTELRELLTFCHQHFSKLD
ncbi:MAG: NAD-dependent epimerase/dehydratase family protein [Bacteroidia bacterium]